MYKAICMVASVLVLSACQTQPVSEGSGYSVPKNSTFVLNEDVQIPVGWARVFVQNGKVTEPGKVNEFYPYCQIVQIALSQPGEDPQVIRADEFRTGKFVRWYTHARPGTVFAGTSMPHSGDHSNRTFSTQIWLHSPRQPEVRKLVCGFWGDPALERHLNIKEIRAVLGDLATLTLRDG